MLISLVNNIGLLITSSNSILLKKIKLIVILVVLYRSAHQKNNSYFPILIALYLYSSVAWINTMKLLNYLDINMSYDIL